MSYLRLLIDYRPEQCHKCQFSIRSPPGFLAWYSLCRLFLDGHLFFLRLFANSSTVLPPRTSYCMWCGWWLSAKEYFFPVPPRLWFCFGGFSLLSLPLGKQFSIWWERLVSLLEERGAGASPNLPGCHPSCSPEYCLNCMHSLYA